MSQASGYTRAQIALHWLTVALVAAQYLFHEWISDAFEERIEDGVMAVPPGAALHLAGGMLVLGIVIYRLYLRSTFGAPPPPDGEPGWAQLMGKIAHWGFYGILVVMPVTGAVAWAQGSEAAGEVHEALTGLLLALIAAHLAAVVVHQLVWKTGILSRMTRPSS